MYLRSPKYRHCDHVAYICSHNLYVVHLWSIRIICWQVTLGQNNIRKKYSVKLCKWRVGLKNEDLLGVLLKTGPFLLWGALGPHAGLHTGRPVALGLRYTTSPNSLCLYDVFFPLKHNWNQVPGWGDSGQTLELSQHSVIYEWQPKFRRHWLW